MAPKTKKEVEIPAFDLRKPDLSPIDRKLAQGDDETTLSEAFQMMVYVPHTDGYRVSLSLYTILYELLHDIARLSVF